MWDPDYDPENYDEYSSNTNSNYSSSSNYNSNSYSNSNNYSSNSYSSNEHDTYTMAYSLASEVERDLNSSMPYHCYMNNASYSWSSNKVILEIHYSCESDASIPSIKDAVKNAVRRAMNKWSCPYEVEYSLSCDDVYD